MFDVRDCIMARPRAAITEYDGWHECLIVGLQVHTSA